MSEAKVGAETQAWCTSCRLMYEHVIVAMVGKQPAKVECAKCHKQHLFRAGPPGTAKVKPPAGGVKKRVTTASRAEPARTELDEAQLAALTRGREARLYTPGTLFAAGDVVRHPSFGVGVVLLLPGPQKMEVAFVTGQKLLAHGRDALGPQLAHPAPRRDDDNRRVSDAPPAPSIPSAPSDRPPRT